jgi:hypothetical protein
VPNGKPLTGALVQQHIKSHCVECRYKEGNQDFQTSTEIDMSQTPTKDTATTAAAEAAAAKTPEADGKPAAKKDPPPSATNGNAEDDKEKITTETNDEEKKEEEKEEEKPKAPKVKLVAAKTLLIRRALASPHTAGTPDDTPTLVPGTFDSAAAAATNGGSTTTAPPGNPTLQMPLPNLPHTDDFPQQFASFQQRQQQQFFAAQAYQRALAMELHNKAMKAAQDEKKRKEAAALAAATTTRRRSRGRPRKRSVEGAALTTSPKPAAGAAPPDGEVTEAPAPMLEWEGRPTEELEGGWPEGWMKRTYVRQVGNSAGTKDSYWFTPAKNYRLRSIIEVKAFLWALEKNNGDEVLARQALVQRRAKKKPKVEEPPPQPPQSEFTAGAAMTAPLASPVGTNAVAPAAAATPAPAAEGQVVVAQVGQPEASPAVETPAEEMPAVETPAEEQMPSAPAPAPGLEAEIEFV